VSNGRTKRVPDLTTFALWQNLAIIVVGAAGVWLGGTRLSNYVDAVSTRTRVTEALAGLLLLGFVTSLPEVATTLTASLGGNAQLATSNLLGGVAMQTAVLAMVDFAAVRGALTYFTPKPVLLMQGVMVILLLAIALAGSAAGERIVVSSVGLSTIGLITAYVAGVAVTERFERRDSWRAVNPPDNPVRSLKTTDRLKKMSNVRLALAIGTMSVLILVCGWLVTKASEAVAEQTGLGATFVGVTLLAITTSLPELSTTIQAARLGAYAMAVSNIFGSNAMDTAMLFIADVAYRKGPILRDANVSTHFAAALGILLTCVYLFGLLERENRSVARLGWDSAAVALLYIAGLAVLYTLK
jgi:cation:H+ antiporter